jgi:hypothetical protein
MANFFSSTHANSSVSLSNPFSPFEIGTVEQVILDFTKITANLSEIDKFYPELTDNDYVTKDGMFYGAIRYKRIGTDGELNEDRLPIAFPLTRNNFTLPVINEIVKLHDMAGRMYYEKISPENSPNFNTELTLLYANAKQTQEGVGSANKTILDTYNETNVSGIATNTRHNHLSSTIRQDFVGEYFKRNMRIHQLALNEGDTLLQGRFGNSIRFSGYIHDDKNNGTQHPAILIRNGESNKNQQKKVYDVVSEDINEDGTSIQITSGKYKTLYDSTTIKVNKEANDTYPSSDQLIGDQIVVNSGRIILSSKTAETFLFSKKKFSIFTDDIVTIDTEKGYKLISQNGNIEITTKGNKNIIMTVNSGSKIFYGKDAADQQAILGNKLVDLLGQLVDAINAMTIATPSGPSSPGTIDKTPFNNIKNQLKDTLSKTNYLI